VFLISDLCDILEQYLEHEQVAEVYRAYLFSAEAHEGQQRLSGEPYIYHPLAVARTLAEMRMDQKSIIAAILHDVIEDTPTAKDQIEKEFGMEVAGLVDGVSKLTKVKIEDRAQAQAENFQKMILAMADDIRVILVKLADRLHNMRTISVMSRDKRRRIARETLDIYSPIAHRLGMNKIRSELENLGFAVLYPMRYRVLDEAVKKGRGNRKEIIEGIEKAIKQRLKEDGLNGGVIGREKHLYSLYQKMREKLLPFTEVFDVYAFRIIVDKVENCYHALGVIHNLYKPVPGKFKDYIAIPKTNGYQSLHTVLFGPYGVPIEVQIKTREMERVAEVGIAAHWLYKTGEADGGLAHDRTRQWLRNVLEMQRNAGNSLEFLENVKIDLFPDVVYVFTPKGQIKELLRGTTAVDFAYAVHTDVGNTCVAAKINRRLMPLRTELLNGQTVEIITAPGARPNPLWLDFIVTGKARSNIRHYLKNLQSQEAVELGKRLLNKSLSTLSSSLDEISSMTMASIAESHHFENVDSLFEDIGLGNRAGLFVAQQLLHVDNEEKSGIDLKEFNGRHPSTIRNVFNRYVPSFLRGDKTTSRPLLITGTEGMVMKFAKCCRPIPGDPVLGFITTGRGIVVHTESCKNVVEFRKTPEKWIDVRWEPDAEGDFPVDIRVEVINQRGVLATAAATIADMGANIDNVNIEDHDGKYSTITFTIEVNNRKHLANIMRQLRSLDQVAKIYRVKG